MAYVYTHTRADTNEVFYVGIGNTPNHKRAYDYGKRNKHWYAIASKTTYTVCIVYDDLTWKEACIKERELISKYGRVDMATGTLCNWTNGGEGSNGAIVREETRLKITKAKTGKKKPPITDKARQNLKNAMIGRTPANFHTLHTIHNEKRVAGLKGSFSEKTIQFRSNRWLANKNPRTTEVLNLENGIFYDNLNEAWKASGLNISRSFFSMMLLGTRKNKTSFITIQKQTLWLQ
jgi:hypothetical protein